MEDLAPEDHHAILDKELQISATVSTAQITKEPKTMVKNAVQIRAQQLRGWVLMACVGIVELIRKDQAMGSHV